MYRRLLKSIDPEISELLNKRTKTVGVSNRVVETIISNYEDRIIDDNEFVRTLALFDKRPEDFGFDMDAEIDAEPLINAGIADRLEKIIDRQSIPR